MASAQSIAWDPGAGMYYDVFTGEQLSAVAAELLLGYDEPAAGGGNPVGGSFAPVTAAENQINLDAAAAEALQRAGITADRGSWSSRDSSNYIKEFRSIIIASPWMFTEETVAVARGINVARVEDYGLSQQEKLIQPDLIMVAVTDFVAEPVNMLRPLAQIPGKITDAADAILRSAEKIISGVGNAAALSPVLLPIAAVAVVWFLAKGASSDIRRFAS